MSLASKQSVLRVFFIVVALWPLIHFGATKAFDINPWKLCGFAMYTVPHPEPRVVLLALAGEATIPFGPDHVSDEAMERLKRFGFLRQGLGRLVTPERLGQRLLDEQPDIDGVRIEVHQKYIDLADGMLKLRRTAYEYRR
jgi:hypothetical protein